jgi:hypothetical protein
MVGVDDVRGELGHGGADDPGEDRLVFDDLDCGQGGADRAGVGHDVAQYPMTESRVMAVEADDAASALLDQVRRHREIPATPATRKVSCPLAWPCRIISWTYLPLPAKSGI